MAHSFYNLVRVTSAIVGSARQLCGCESFFVGLPVVFRLSAKMRETFVQTITFER